MTGPILTSPPLSRLLLLAVGVAAAGLSQPALAQVAEGTAVDDLKLPLSAQLDVKLVAGVWIPRLGGKVTLGPAPGANEIGLENDFDLDRSEALLNLELSIRKGDRWELNFSGFDFSTENSGVFTDSEIFGALAIDPGDAFDSRFDLTSFAIELAWWGDNALNKKVANPRGSTTTFRYAPGVGIRYVDVEHSLVIPGEGREDAGGEWLAPFAAIHIAVDHHTPDGFPLVDRFLMDGFLAAGPALGGEGGLLVNLGVGITAFCGDNLGLTFGYRLANLNVENNDEYEVNAGLQGLFVGGTIEF